MKWYEKMIEQAKSFIRNGHSLQPMLFMRSGKSVSIVHLGRFSENKEVLARILHVIVQLEDPDAYLYITEAYVKMLDAKDVGDAALGSLLVEGTIQVSQLPSAQEAITILLGDRKGEKLGMIVFKRENKSVVFEAIKWLEGDELKGRFTGLRGGGKPSPSGSHKSPERGRN
jgi:hypothetical protein